jgi:hypothetical protein
MRFFLKFLLLAVTFEAVIFFAYLWSNNTTSFQARLYTLGTIGLLGLSYIFFKILAANKLKTSAYFAILISIMSVTVYQLVAFSGYAGLAKDLDFFSGGHFKQVAILTIFSAGLHVTLLFGVFMARKITSLVTRNPD